MRTCAQKALQRYNIFLTYAILLRFFSSILPYKSPQSVAGSPNQPVFYSIFPTPYVFCISPLSLFLPLPFPYQLREGVRRNALRVLRPKSPHSEEIAQYIEWRDLRGPRPIS